MSKPSRKKAPAAVQSLDVYFLPSRRRELELEFHQWAKNTGARVDVFNVIGWLQERGMMLSDSKQKILLELRDEFRRMGWPQTAAKIDEVLKD